MTPNTEIIATLIKLADLIDQALTCHIYAPDEHIPEESDYVVAAKEARALIEKLKAEPEVHETAESQVYSAPEGFEPWV
jgi:hypothetical protein